MSPLFRLLIWFGVVVIVPCGALAEETISAGTSRITLQLAPELSTHRADVLDWVQRAVDAVAGYYGQFPVPAVRLVVAVRSGEPVNSGREFGGERISIHLDPEATRDDLHRDWMLTHEMFHLGFPSLNRRYHYMEEGLSDYLEPLARARAGQVTPEHAWNDFVEGMPKGLPSPGDSGLDGTRAWGKTYWGGCIFWLLVDLDIRERTGNRKSLDDAIRAMVKAGGTGGEDWPLEKVIAVGDQATGTDSLAKIHQLVGASAYDPHLDPLWARLGIKKAGTAIVWDEQAPLAAIRKSMTAPAIAKPMAGKQ